MVSPPKLLSYTLRKKCLYSVFFYFFPAFFSVRLRKSVIFGVFLVRIFRKTPNVDTFHAVIGWPNWNVFRKIVVLRFHEDTNYLIITLRSRNFLGKVLFVDWVIVVLVNWFGTILDIINWFIDFDWFVLTVNKHVFWNFWGCFFLISCDAVPWSWFLPSVVCIFRSVLSKAK